MNISIVTAESEHIPDIYSLVEELAVFEKAREEIWLTLEDYQQLYRDGAFEAIVALSEEEVIGTCIYYMTFSTWKGKMLYLEDFVVRESERGLGVGQLLFDEFLQIAKNKGCALAKWQVLDWNEPAVKFYSKNNVIIDDGWWTCKIIF